MSFFQRCPPSCPQNPKTPCRQIELSEAGVRNPLPVLDIKSDRESHENDVN